VLDEVILLGTKGGPAIRPGSTMPSSSLLRMSGRQIVVDCGLGVTRSLTKQDVQLKMLSDVFITHLHSDHYLELGPMLHTAWTAGLNSKVTIWGPDGLDTYWTGFLSSMQADIDLRIEDEGRPDLSSLVQIKPLDDGHVTDLDGISVSAMRVKHPPLVDCFALSFKSADRHVVFSSDTAYFPALAEFAKDADLLIHEAMLEAALGPLLARIGNGDDRLMKHWLRSHTLASDAAKIAAAANVGALALNHLIPSDDPAFTESDWLAAVKPHWNGRLIVGDDGMRIALA